jgi:thiol-disulfide isomerase/thioredoxin
VGTHTLDISISGMASDGVAANNSFSGTIGVASQSVDRITIIEQFTSSTCPPCANLNTTFGPTLTGLNTNNLGSNVSAVKYHQNFPSPGNDPSYNPDALSRRNYYGVTGIPDLFIDGKPMAATSAAYIQEQAALDAFVDLDLSYTLNGNQINVTANVTPFATFSGTHKLHVVIVENTYNYAASTTTQDVFKQVQRKMMPNANGTNLASLTADQTQTFSLSHTMVLGGAAQGNSNTWVQDLENLTIVAFVQNVSTKAILQANFSPVVLNVGVEENAADQRLRVFPNPTEGLINVQYEAPASGAAQIEVFNVLGERVFAATRAMGAGTQREVIDLSALNNGIYFVNITADGVRASRKVTLNK